MNIREVLALNLRQFRNAQKVSQEELADRADIDRTYVSALERCVHAASIDVVERLARALELEAADLLRRPPPPQARKTGEGKPSLEHAKARSSGQTSGRR
jgi:transcriptional regulator with XRE-family HTH domain